MKTFEDYQTATAKDGRAILRRILDALLDAPECFYPVRGQGMATGYQLAWWEARNTDIRALASDPLPATEDMPETDADSFEDLIRVNPVPLTDKAQSENHS